MTKFTKPVSIEFHEDDLPDGLSFGNRVAIDTETQGLNPHRDRLCLAQFSAGDGICHLVRFKRDAGDAPNIRALLTNPGVSKMFHYARFDVAVFQKTFGITVSPVYCTKIASRLARTYTSGHGLKDVVRELVGVELSKVQQSSDWASDNLSDEQLEYAAFDVLFLHQVREKLDVILQREGRQEMAEQCFKFLETRCKLDLEGWPDMDIFSH